MAQNVLEHLIMDMGSTTGTGNILNNHTTNNTGSITYTNPYQVTLSPTIGNTGYTTLQYFSTPLAPPVLKKLSESESRMLSIYTKKIDFLEGQINSYLREKERLQKVCKKIKGI